MNYKKLMKSLIRAALVLVVLALTAGPSFGANITVSLAAVEAQWLPPGGTSGADEITMWGFIEATSCPAPPVTWDVGVEISALAGDNLTINLLNCLSEPVSIVIPGQAAIGAPVFDGDRVQSFTYEVSAGGGPTSYTWTDVKAGTYLYQSGSHPALQVPMGLYGALIVDPATAGAAYTPTVTNPATGYTAEVVLLYSEIDMELHDPPGVAQPMNYIPEYYLINGKPYKEGDPPATAGNINQNVLIRFLNAGLKTHVPMLLNAPYMSVIAEDGNLYPYAKTQYSVLLAAGKTMDAIWSPTAQGTFPLVDRTNTLTTAGVTDGGNYAYLEVGTTVGAPVAVDDTYAVVEDGSLVATAGGATPGVLDNDTGGTTAVLISGPSAGSLVSGLNIDGSFTYTPNPNFNGTDIFMYQSSDGTLASNVATVSITVTPVNYPPVAVNDTYIAFEGIPLNVAAPGVLGNDSDPDGDSLTAVLETPVSGGTLALSADGSFTYTPNTGTISDSFTYFANDGTVSSATSASVTITVSAPVNTEPVAADDFATTTKNTTVFINLVDNDTDAENNIDPNGIIIVTNPTRGGTVTVLTNGVNYAPKKNFRGTDVFTYTVSDTLGETSNTATVRVNVINN